MILFVLTFHDGCFDNLSGKSDHLSFNVANGSFDIFL